MIRYCVVKSRLGQFSDLWVVCLANRFRGVPHSKKVEGSINNR
jgi:hypothetical protein